MKDQELIWVDKDLAKKYAEINSDIEKAKMVNGIILDRKLDITADIQNLDDDLLRFKAFALNYSTEFKKAYDEQSVNLEKIWEDSQEPMNKIATKTRVIKDEIGSIKSDLNDITGKLNTLNFSKLERLIDLMEKFNHMSAVDKKSFEILLSNEKTHESNS